jgi:hypothetical protein
MSSSLPQTATNSQSLNGILTLSDGVVTIENGVISGLTELELTDLQVSDTATIQNLVVNNQIDMTSGRITNLADPVSAQDAATKYYTDNASVNTNYLKRDGSLAMLGAIDMNTSNKIINLAEPTDNSDATNKQYVDGTFLNKVISTTQTFQGKIDFIGTNYITGIALPVLDLITSTSGASNGAFIRTYKNLNRVANLEIGGLSYISEVPTNNVRREVDLIFRTNANTLAEMVINMNNSTLTPFLINEDKYETKNNNYNILKQDGTQLLYYTSSNDVWAMSKDLNMTQNDITNANTLQANFNLKVVDATSGFVNPAIQFQNTTTGSGNGIYMRFYKNFNRLPDTELGGIIFADKNAASQATSRAVQLKVSIGSDSTPIFDILFNSDGFNPLRVSNTQNILSNDDFYIKNKTSGQDLFTYLNASGKFTMYKKLDMNNTNNISNLAEPISNQDAATKYYSDNASVNTNYLKRDGSLPMLGAIDMNTTNKIINVAPPTDNGDAVNKQFLDGNFINKTTTSTQDVKGKLVFDDISQDIITFQNNLATASNGMRLLFKKNVTSHPFLYVGGFTWADLNSNGTVRRMVEMAVSNDGSTMPVFQMIMNTGTFTPVTINTTVTSLRNKEFYFINQQDSSNILTYLNSTNKIKMYKELDCTNISSTGNLSCVDLTTTGNQVCGTNSTNTLDVKSSTSFEADVLVKNNNHLMLGGNPTSTGGMRLIYDSDYQTNGTAYIDSRATSLNFRLNPTGNPTSNKVVISNNQTLVNSNFAVNGNTIIGNNSNSDTCTFNCQATFPAGSYINGARINLISKTSDFTLDYEVNFENGCICNHTSGTLNITMPNTGGDSGQYWRRRNYIIKVRETTVKLKQNTTTLNTKIDNLTGDVNYTTDWKTINLVFDENYHENGQIWIISDR